MFLPSFSSVWSRFNSCEHCWGKFGSSISPGQVNTASARPLASPERAISKSQNFKINNLFTLNLPGNLTTKNQSNRSKNTGHIIILQENTLNLRLQWLLEPKNTFENHLWLCGWFARCAIRGHLWTLYRPVSGQNRRISGSDRPEMTPPGWLTAFVSAICGLTRSLVDFFDTINNGRHWGTFAMNVTSRWHEIGK